MPDEPAADLLARFVQGDREAFEALFREFHLEVRRWSLRIVREPSAADAMTAGEANTRYPTPATSTMTESRAMAPTRPSSEAINGQGPCQIPRCRVLGGPSLRVEGEPPGELADHV